MGGIGSGRQWHWNAKSTTADFLALDIRQIARAGYLEPWRSFSWNWSRNGERVADIRVVIEGFGARLKYRTRSGGGDWEPMEYTVPFLSQPCHYGGHRKWFACPARGCGRRVAILYGGTVFACRQCHNLAYPSQREEHFQRATRRAERIKERLGWQTDFGGKPKGMHWKTFERLVRELDYWDNVWNSAFVARFSGLLDRDF